MAAQGYLCHIPVLKEESDCVAGSLQLDDEQRVITTLFSPELLDETEEPLSDRQEFSSAIMCKPIKAHAFAVPAEMLSPNRTRSLKTLSSSLA